MQQQKGFQRTIGLFPAISLVITSIIGSGIFMRPAEMAALLGSPGLVFLAWIIAGLFTLLSVMVIAEVASMLPEAGGTYAMIRHMYGDFWAYLYGWAAFAVINCAGTAGISFIASQYAEYFFKLPRFSAEIEHSLVFHIPLVGEFYPLDNFGVKILTITILSFFSVISYRSTKATGMLQAFFSTAKVIAIILLVGGLLFSGQGAGSNFFMSSATIHPAGFAMIAAMVAACNGALQALDGCNNMLYMSGEIVNPERTIPKSLFIGLSICIIIYLLVNAAMFYVLPVDKMAQSALVASDAAQVAFGTIGGGLIAFLICLSVMGTTSANVFTPPRITHAMAMNGQFFSIAGRIHPRFHTPGNAILLHLALMTILVLSGSFFILADMYIFITWTFNLMLVVGLFILRKRMPVKYRPYKVWGYPWLPVIVIIFNAFYLTITLIDDVRNYLSGKTQIMNSVFGLFITALGIPLYYYFNRKKKN